ncbi:hypothetical protein GCM10007989_00020 [Devosia pacifica]|uniref:DUF1761 domain-containing protein n=1 Tax=Devosia pacifica TaxID=1335967 RepID=A0A918RR18_9HYPH|nr:DUF1761 domain-containing protein [Devosia pacifica]GHA09917.1 hypothetical protein GCM10007989_00020 [Devosia pacifica]
MFNVFGQINWIGFIAATIISQALGAVWFTALFGKVYAKALGREGKPAAFAPIFIVGPLICNLILAISMAQVMAATSIDGIGNALVFGLIVGFGFLATTTINTGINPNTPRPLLYGAGERILFRAGRQLDRHHPGAALERYSNRRGPPLRFEQA